jgi:hypothetical protein
MAELRELSNLQIDQYYRGNPRYGGCFSKDQSKDFKNGKFYILNMDHPSGNGTHWVLLYLVDPIYAVYFDSFGAPMPQQELNWISRHRHGNCLINEREVQSLGSITCGYFCLYVCDMLLKGLPFHSVLAAFRDSTRYNEHMIRSYVIKHGF